MPTQNIDYADKSTGGNFTAADANDIKSAVNTNAALQFINAPVESALPAVSAAKAGELFYYNGTLWTYAKTGQFGTLSEGTPWPVRGYKEIRAKIKNELASAPAVPGSVLYINDFGIDLSSIGFGSYAANSFMVSLQSFTSVVPDEVVIFNGYDSVDDVIIETYADAVSGGFVLRHKSAIPSEITFTFFLRQYPPQS